MVPTEDCFHITIMPKKSKWNHPKLRTICIWRTTFALACLDELVSNARWRSLWISLLKCPSCQRSASLELEGERFQPWPSLFENFCPLPGHVSLKTTNHSVGDYKGRILGVPVLWSRLDQSYSEHAPWPVSPAGSTDPNRNAKFFF